MGRASVVVFLFVGFAACHRSDEDELGLKVKKVDVVEVDKLTDPAQLVIALTQAGEAADAKLGARGFELVSTTTLSANGASDRIDERTTFDTDGHGAFHVVHNLEHPDQVGLAVPKGEGETATREQVNVSAQGMEAVVLAGTVYARPRYGHFISRRPEPSEIDTLRALAEQRMGDDVQLLAPFVSIRAAGNGNVLGHVTHKLELALDASPSSSKDERAWRKNMKVMRIDGELEVDAATGVLLAGKLDTEYKVARDAGPLTTHLNVTLTARAAQPIVAPDASPSPHRPRPMVERNQLLEGLAPPAGTQAARTN